MLTVEQLQNRAEEQAGLSDWGSDLSFLHGLSAMVDAANRDDPHRSTGLAEDMTALLVTRLRLVADETSDPTVLDVPVERPLILIGLSRTGTTILHTLLALDPAARAPLEWETGQPWPAPEIGTFTTDPRIQQRQEAIDRLLEAAPRIRSMHRYGPTLPSDCINFMSQHFVSASFWARYALDEYAYWLRDSSAEGLYTTHRRLLQQLAWKGPRGRWVLKEPMHQLHLAQLAAEYPDACFVQTHRDPVRTLPSVASLIHTIQELREPDRDPRRVGRVVRDVWGECIDRSTRLREDDPELDARVLDVAYADTVTDPVGQVRRIYDHFGFPFTAEHSRRIEEHLAAGGEAGHGRHAYDGRDFGLEPDELAQAFPEYRERFAAFLHEPGGQR